MLIALLPAFPSLHAAGLYTGPWRAGPTGAQGLWILESEARRSPSRKAGTAADRLCELGQVPAPLWAQVLSSSTALRVTRC